MRTMIAVAALLAMTGGCAVAQTSNCFTTRRVVLPDKAKILSRLSNGQAGRDLAEAIWRGDVASVATQLRADPRLASTRVVPDPSLTSQPDGQYGDLLTFAVARCNRPVVEALLDGGVPADGASVGQALALALLSDDPQLPEALLARGASADPQKAGGVDVFDQVSAASHIGGVMMLLRHGLDVKWADAFGRTHLDTALMMQNYAIAELLLKAGADLWHADRDGFTPAHQLAAPTLKALSVDDAAARDRMVAAAKAGGRAWPPAPPPR